MIPGGPISAFSCIGSRSRQNAAQEFRFKHFLALAPEVDKMNPRRSYLTIFWHWLLLVSRFLSFLVSWPLICWFLVCFVSWFPWCLRVLVSWFLDFFVSWFQSFRAPKFQRSNKSFNVCWKILIPYYQPLTIHHE